MQAERNNEQCGMQLEEHLKKQVDPSLLDMMWITGSQFQKVVTTPEEILVCKNLHLTDLILVRQADQ